MRRRRIQLSRLRRDLPPVAARSRRALLARMTGAGAMLFCAVVGGTGSDGTRTRIQFEDVTDASGIDYSGPGAGAAWGDVNGDGFPDLWTSNHGRSPSVFINSGNGVFTEASDIFQGSVSGDTHGAAWGDVDNDGDQDLIVLVGANSGSGGGANLLYINDGQSLREDAVVYGVDYPLGRGRTPLWLDWNGDGLLDLIASNWVRSDGMAPSAVLTNQTTHFQLEGIKLGFETTDNNSYLQLLRQSATRVPLLVVHSDTSFPDRVYDYQGNAPMLDVTASVGLTPVTKVKESITGDFNGDLWDDLVLLRFKNKSSARVFEERRLATDLVPQGDEKAVTFEASALVRFEFKSGVSANDIFLGATGEHPLGTSFDLTCDDEALVGVFQHEPGLDFGVYLTCDTTTGTWTVAASSATREEIELIVEADLSLSGLTLLGFANSDGDLDDMLLLQGPEGFVDESATAGLPSASQCESGVAADFDNDMDLDLYLVCRTTAFNLPNRLLVNFGPGVFFETPTAGGALGSDEGTGDVAVTADFDNDGAVDLLVTNGRRSTFNEGPYELFRNTGNDNHFLMLRLIGTVSNRDGIGATVTAIAGGVSQVRFVDGGAHRFAQNDRRVHFGLAQNKRVDVLQIDWPSGRRQRLRDIAADQILDVHEP